MKSATKYIVFLSQEDKDRLLAIRQNDTLQENVSKHILILLALDDRKNSKLSYRQIASALNVHFHTVTAVARNYSQHGLDYAIFRHKPCSHPRKVTDELRAYVIQLIHEEVPEGHTYWTLRLLAEKVNKKGIAEPISKETIRKILQNEAKSSHEFEITKKGLRFYN